jgi:hypothetical protein
VRSPSKLFLIDGVEKIGYAEAAKACGVKLESFAVYIKQRFAGTYEVDIQYKGHRVQCKSGKLATAPLLPPPPAPVVEELHPIDSMPEALKSVKEEIRFLRECLIGRLHSLDEIMEHVRSIEKRVIEEKHVRGRYTDDAGNMEFPDFVQAERLG